MERGNRNSAYEDGIHPGRGCSTDGRGQLSNQRAICRLLTACFLAVGLAPSACTHAGDGATCIRLKSSAVVASPRVRLADVADVIDADPARRERLRDLDLARLDQQQELTLQRTFVEIRVLLAGFDRESLTFQGPQAVTVLAREPVSLTDLGVEQAVFDSLCRQFDVPREDLRVKLVSPFIGTWLMNAAQLKQPQIELVPSPQIPLGRTQLTVRIIDGDRVVAARPASFEIARRQSVVVAVTSLDRANVITPGDVRQEIQFVDAAVDQLSTQQVTGRKVLLPLRPGEIVTLRHVGEEATPESPILVQTRDAVRLVARKQGLTVTVPVAEALQPGRQGQLIRVRNLQSNQIVTGRVVGRGEVEVLLD